MSTPFALTPAALQAIYASLESGRIAISAGYAAAALVLYDFFLTFSSELNKMWLLKKKNLVFFLFIVLRYSTIFYQVTFSMAFFLPIHSNKGCAAIIYVEQAMFIFSSATLSTVFALRTFAIYRRNWYILVSLGLLASVKVFISATDFFVQAKVAAQSPQFRQFGSCSQSVSGNYAKWNTASAALALAFDTIVVTLTVAKTARSWIQTREAGMKNSYSYYILRDVKSSWTPSIFDSIVPMISNKSLAIIGLLYYFGVEFLLLFTVVFNQIPALSIRVARVVIILQTSVAPILAQRLILNLLSVDKILSPSLHLEQSLDTMDFAHGSIIGNIGAPLDMGQDHDVVEIRGSDQKQVRAIDANRRLPYNEEGLEGIQMVEIREDSGGEKGRNDTVVGFVL